MYRRRNRSQSKCRSPRTVGSVLAVKLKKSGFAKQFGLRTKGGQRIDGGGDGAIKSDTGGLYPSHRDERRLAEREIFTHRLAGRFGIPCHIEEIIGNLKGQSDR